MSDRPEATGACTAARTPGRAIQEPCARCGYPEGLHSKHVSQRVTFDFAVDQVFVIPSVAELTADAPVIEHQRVIEQQDGFGPCALPVELVRRYGNCESPGPAFPICTPCAWRRFHLGEGEQR